MPRAVRSARALATIGATATGLLGAPAAAYFGLQLRGMLYAEMIDPYLSTAYAVNGPDLIRRFGTDEYYWTRVGFSIPAHLFDRVFGAVGGFYGFRYLLALIAIVPVFLLLRALWGAAAGWVGVIAVLTSQVVITGWSTDYPTAAAISYLMAGAAFLFMPTTTTRARVTYGALAGLAFGLAVGSGLVAAVAILGAGTGRIVAATRAEWRRSVATLAIAALATVVSFALVALAARAYLGNADIVTPQLQALHRFGEAIYRNSFHSSTWRWLVDDIYVLAPLAVLGAWVIAAWPFSRARTSRVEIGFAVASAVTYALFTIYQFVLYSWSLEYWYYADMLWAFTVPLLVMTAFRIASSAGALSRLQTLAVGLAMLAVPIALRFLRDQLHFSLKAAFALTVIPALAVLVARLVPVLTVRLASMLVVVTAPSLLIVGLPVFTLFPDQAAYVTPDFGTALFGSSDAARDEYAVTTSLHKIVPTTAQTPGGLAMWLPARPSHLVLSSSAQYLFLLNALPDRLPALTSQSVAFLEARSVHVLVLLSDTGDEFAAADDALRTSPLVIRDVATSVLTSGSARLQVQVVQLS
ncbi:MAG: hypothetical protein ACREN2_00660 [Candidatus Dormibacteria bacterium]